ncbi:hypothetical protein CWE13_02985 [Aliidiomarina shirensis]|uniref:Uncharacterized protein n=1 Tax=Aliidiomarina shirensis TaxID=1048642 RepID=A0A432WXY6_9GAMM|nr:hypothetical protein [Aliidiomarina shirensis]RUO38625.1 hypothetical protein CWE13_02985 [Aliidiomarina shirensis]
MRYVTIELTQGNINNNHLYLSSAMKMFPTSSVGGANSDSMADVLLEVHSGIGDPIKTDIAGDKKIFRKRSWVGEFFRAHALKAGDKVVVQSTGENRYHVYPSRG